MPLAFSLALAFALRHVPILVETSQNNNHLPYRFTAIHPSLSMASFYGITNSYQDSNSLIKQLQRLTFAEVQTKTSELGKEMWKADIYKPLPASQSCTWPFNWAPCGIYSREVQFLTERTVNQPYHTRKWLSMFSGIDLMWTCHIIVNYLWTPQGLLVH